ncbi:hypothetical protein GS4_08_02370 [Gordonia soli NBRC 108243]|uniref:Uncharacterized protein n=1 Tax=Gordonia soli NBRC 108243 TaxID=1223545 RepID=M0QJN9_9ACTN|nr:hypothetical protein GS4_08_02370 [Gordonia soli NBRC 108243]
MELQCDEFGADAVGIGAEPAGRDDVVAAVPAIGLGHPESEWDAGQFVGALVNPVDDHCGGDGDEDEEGDRESCHDMKYAPTKIRLPVA